MCDNSLIRHPSSPLIVYLISLEIFFPRDKCWAAKALPVAVRAASVCPIHRSSSDLVVFNLISNPHLLIVGFCQACGFLFPLVPYNSVQAITSSSLLHLSALLRLLPEISWNILSARTASSHFPSTFFCSPCYYLFILFKKCILLLF